jgi:hypothetical protein
VEGARWLRAGWKLTRQTAVQDSQTKVIFRQPEAELALVRELCRRPGARCVVG